MTFFRNNRNDRGDPIGAVCSILVIILVMIFGNFLDLLPHPQLILAAVGIFLIIFDPVWHYLTRPRTSRWIETTGVVVDYIEKHGGLNRDNRVDWEQVPVVAYETADGTKYRVSYQRHWTESHHSYHLHR